MCSHIKILQHEAQPPATHTTHTRGHDTRFSEAEANRRGALVWEHLRAHPTTIHLPQPARAYTYTISDRNRRQLVSTASGTEERARPLRSPALRHSSRSQCSPAWALSCGAVTTGGVRYNQNACRHLRGLRGFELRHSDLSDERGVRILRLFVQHAPCAQPVCTRVVELGVLLLDPTDG